MLEHVFADRELPVELVEHFLAEPQLAKLLSRRYLDFHHVWFYALQRLRCRHPVIERMAAQARRGPDLAVLEKWYPRALSPTLPAGQVDVMRRNAERLVGVMTEDEMTTLEHLEVPAFVPPACEVVA